MLQILKAGTFLDDRGREHTFTPEILEEISNSYNPKSHRAPILEGHDESKDNHGVVTGIEFKDGGLWAKVNKVGQKFAQKVNEQILPSISPALYEPSDPNNPTPGKWHLRHVGFVQIPAIKGMAQPAFAEDENAVVLKPIQFNEFSDMTAADLFGMLREFMLTRFGQETADQYLPAFMIDSLKRNADDQLDEMGSAITGFSERIASIEQAIEEKPEPDQQSEPQKEDETMADAPDIEKQLADLEAAKAQFEKDKADFEKRHTETRQAQFSEQLDRLVEKGLPVGDKPKHLAVLMTMPEAPVQFAEGETTNGAQSYLKALEGGLTKAPEGEAAGGQVGEVVDDPIAFAEKAMEIKAEYEQKGTPISNIKATQIAKQRYGGSE